MLGRSVDTQRDPTTHLRYEELVPLQLYTHVRGSIVDERFESVLEQQHAVFNA